MSSKFFAIVVGIAIVAFATTAQAALTIGGYVTPPSNPNPLQVSLEVIFGPGGGSSTPANPGPRTYGILIGSQAPSGSAENVIRGDRDVSNVAAQLSWATELSVLKYNWNGSNTVAGDISSVVSGIASKINPGDSVIFYYSGHGTGGSGLGVQDFLNPVSSGGFQDNSLASLFVDTRFDSVKKCFLIDSCHAEGLWLNDSANDRDLQSLKNVSFLGSSTEDGVAFSDINKDGTSIFTNAILASLSKDASFGSIVASAMSLDGVQAAGYTKEGGYATGIMHPIAYQSSDYGRIYETDNAVLIPEPGSIFLVLSGFAMILIWSVAKKTR
jgi:hypothetical protein